MKLKAFPTAHVLSVITGRLMGDIGGVYTVLNWMAGESVCTHQIPRISREAQAAMIAFRPDLQQAIDEAEQVSRDNYLDWLAIWAARYGDAIAVVKLNADQHERIDPIFELAEMIMPDRIVAVLARSDAALRCARRGRTSSGHRTKQTIYRARFVDCAPKTRSCAS